MKENCFKSGTNGAEIFITAKTQTYGYVTHQHKELHNWEVDRKGYVF